MSRRSFAVAPALGFALVALALLPLHAHAQDAGGLVGAWYGELAVSETKGGNPVNYRRWVRINRPDGTQTITFRFYFDSKLPVGAGLEWRVGVPKPGLLDRVPFHEQRWPLEALLRPPRLQC